MRLLFIHILLKPLLPLPPSLIQNLHRRHSIFHVRSVCRFGILSLSSFFLIFFESMAIEMCDENSGISPRISFSHDLSQTDGVPVEHLLRSSSSSSVDFDFFVFRDHESSSADELFSDGKILPIQIQRKISPPRKKTEPPSAPPPASIACNGVFENSVRSSNFSSPDETKPACSESDDKQSSSKSFWRFKRSSSLNCGSGYARTLCPLPLLSRSNSTGSASSVKKSAASKDGLSHKQHSQKPNPSVNSTRNSQSSSSATTHQKPPLKKNAYGSHANGVRFNPVLNVPTANLFGFGSIFSNSKDKIRKK